MAAHYISEICKLQPRGPYSIGGYCFGGLVAFEMAHQLRAMGEQAALVALFSAPLRFHRLVEPKRTTISAAASAKNTSKFMRLLLSPRQAIRWRVVSLARSLRSRLHMLTCRAFLGLGLKVPQALRTMYVVRMISRAERAYAPRPYPGTLTLFRGHGLYEQDPNLGWDGLAEQLETFEIGSAGQNSRRDIMNEPLVSLLAAQLSACLKKQQAPQQVVRQRLETNAVNGGRVSTVVGQ